LSQSGAQRSNTPLVFGVYFYSCLFQRCKHFPSHHVHIFFSTFCLIFASIFNFGLQNFASFLPNIMPFTFCRKP
jgi:hypothetical protein